MSDLISREKTLYRLATSAVYYFDLEEDKAAHDWAMHIVSGMPDEEPGIVRCKECKHFHYDMPYVIQGIPILGHEVCDFWGDGCKTNENGFCSYAERRTDE